MPRVQSPASNLKIIGVTSKGILKYLFKTIQPTTYFVQILNQSLNKIQFIKLLEIYQLNPKDFIKQDSQTLYENSHNKSMLNAAKKIAKERMEILKQKK